MILHPGPGTIAAVNGVKKIRKLDAVVAAHVKARVGDIVAPRAGVADSVGYVLLRAPTRAALMEACQHVEGLLRIELA
jgi:hypothetical protein